MTVCGTASAAFFAQHGGQGRLPIPIPWRFNVSRTISATFLNAPSQGRFRHVHEPAFRRAARVALEKVPNQGDAEVFRKGGNGFVHPSRYVIPRGFNPLEHCRSADVLAPLPAYAAPETSRER